MASWPVSNGGCCRLRHSSREAPLSNGNVALLTNMARNAGLPWDCILSAELARHYKPDVEVYEKAAELLGLAPESVMMVAAHKDDLHGARAVGFRTAFVPRPREHGPDGRIDTNPDPEFDVVAEDFLELAERL